MPKLDSEKALVLRQGRKFVNNTILSLQETLGTEDKKKLPRAEKKSQFINGKLVSGPISDFISVLEILNQTYAHLKPEMSDYDAFIAKLIN